MTKIHRVVCAGVLIALSCLTAGASAQDPFSIVFIPDPQNYTTSPQYDSYKHETQWIVNNRAARNIQFAIHLGDITNHDTAVEYAVADAAHKVLDDAGFPYSITIGNHELYPSAEVYKRDTLYAQYFGPQRFAGKSFWGGSYDSSNINNYTFFEASGLKFMVVSLEFAPRKDVVTWANKVIQNYPDRRVIVATHCHMDANAEHATGCADGYNMVGREPVDLWEELIQRHSNIFMSVSGHIQGVSYRQRTGNNGNVVHEILNDFQSEPVLGNGSALGNGWLRVLTFKPTQNQIDVETISAEDGNCAIFANCQATLYLNYNLASSPTATKHNQQNYTVSYNMTSTLSADVYKVGDILFHDTSAHTQLTGSHVTPKIATVPNGNFIATWRDDSDGNGVGQIHARGFDPDGNALFSQITVNTADDGEQRNPDVAVDDSGRFVIVWEDDQDGNGSYQILARGFTAAGAQRIADFTVNTVSNGQQFNPAIASDTAGNFVVTWEDDQDDNGKFQIYHRGFNASGSQKFAQAQVNTNSAGQHTKPSISAANNGDYVIVWEDDQDDNGYYQIYGRGYTIAGVQRFGVTTVNSVSDGQQLAPSVGLRGDGGFGVAWEDDKDGNGTYQILGRFFTAAAAQRKADFTVNSDASGQQRLPVVAADDQGRVFVGWQDDMDGDGKPSILLRNFTY